MSGATSGFARRRRGDYYPDRVSRQARRLLDLVADREYLLTRASPVGWGPLREQAANLAEHADYLLRCRAGDLIAAGCAS